MNQIVSLLAKQQQLPIVEGKLSLVVALLV